MGRKSTIARLPEPIQTKIEALIRAGRTIDEIKVHLEALDVEVSRSALGRHKRSYEADILRYKEAREITGQYMVLFEETPEKDLSLLLTEMAKTMVFDSLSRAAGEDTQISPKDLMNFAKTILDLNRSGQINIAHIEKVREKERQRAAAIAETVARNHGLSAEIVSEFRSKILGVS